MLPLLLGRPEAAPLRVLALGAHPDDAEIGCAGTILKLAGQGMISAVCWVVLSGNDARVEEARESAEALLEGVREKQIVQSGFRLRASSSKKPLISAPS
jgi:LmbE family N-acetylglucosaminyl deacetylase